MEAVESEVPSRTAQLVVGGDSFFGPVAPAPNVAVQDARSAAPRVDVLSDVVTSSLKRATSFDTAAAWIDAGLACLADGQVQASRGAFERALSHDPLSRRARLGLARAFKEMGSTDHAIDLLSKLYDENHDDVETRVSLALAFFAEQRIGDALEILDAEPAKTKRNASFFAARGSILLAKKAVASAIHDLRLVVRLRPDWVYARNALGLAEAQIGNTHSAEQRFREAIRVSPFYEEALLNLVQILGSKGSWNEITDVIERYWTPDNSSLGVAFAAGNAALEAGDHRSARRWMDAALSKANTSVDRSMALNNLGVIANRLGKDNEASKLFKSALAEEPTELAVANYGRSLLAEGKPDMAVESLRSWLDTEADGPAVRQTLTAAFYYLGAYADAAALGESLLRTYDERQLVAAGVHALMASVYADGLGQFDNAISIARAGLRLAPNDPVLLNNLAYALLQAGETDEPERVLSLLANLPLTEEKKVYATATRGLLALKRNDLRQGWELYEQAARMAPRESLRERVKAKRDLELARALMATGAEPREIASYLRRASRAGIRPYSIQAEQELRRLQS